MKKKSVFLSLNNALATLVITANSLVAEKYDSFYEIDGFNWDKTVLSFVVESDFDPAPGGETKTYFIDLEADKWLKGSPFRTGSGDGERSWDDSEQEIKTREKIGCCEYGVTVAITAKAEVTDHSKLKWTGDYWFTSPPEGKPFNYVKLEQFQLGKRDGYDCIGYHLIHNGVIVHSDKKIPESRGCPQSYSLREVHCARGKSGYCAVIIEYNLPGFEGGWTEYLVNPIRY